MYEPRREHRELYEKKIKKKSKKKICFSSVCECRRAFVVDRSSPRSKRTATTNSNLIPIFNNVINDININIFDIVLK